MNELLQLIVANWELLISVVVVILSALYAYSKGVALGLLAQAWGVIVGMAKDVLAHIPAADFEVWATMIYDALPPWAAVFTSVAAIKATLMKWRDLLAVKYDAQVRGILSVVKMRELMQDVTGDLRVLLT
jgi:hypothetical protein